MIKCAQGTKEAQNLSIWQLGVQRSFGENAA